MASSVRTRTLAAAALDYGRRGWHVLPVKPRGKIPVTGRGLRDATTDLEQIAAWWNRTPKANVGIACAASGLVVIDLDGPEACRQWQALQRRYGPVGEPLIAASNRGWHFWYRHPGGELVGKLGPGVDVKANGYIVVEPSVHPSGHVYRWHRDGEPQPPPAWLTALLRRRPRPLTPRTPVGRGGGLEALARVVADAQQGNRNNALHWAACRAAEDIAAGHYTPADAAGVLLDAAARCGLPEREAAATIRSGGVR